MISHPRMGAPTQARPAKDVLCSQLSHGIHAAAQPLTILLAGLSKAHTDSMNMAELRELTAGSYEEVQRLCTLFGYLQDLVICESIKPQLSPTSLSLLLAAALEAVQPLLRRDAMALSSTVPENCPLLLINGPRTLRALTTVLLTAHALSSISARLELVAAPSPFGMQINVTNSNLSLLAVSAEARLSLAAAEANIRSQQGSLVWTRQPFNVLIDLPEAPLFPHR